MRTPRHDELGDEDLEDFAELARCGRHRIALVAKRSNLGLVFWQIPSPWRFRKPQRTALASIREIEQDFSTDQSMGKCLFKA